MTSEH